MQKVRNAEKVKEFVTTNQLTAGKAAFISMLGLEVTTETAAASTTTLLSMAMKELAKSTLAALVPLLPFIAGLTALVGALYALKLGWDAYKASTPEGQLQAAKEATDEAKKSLDNATQAVNNLKTS